MMQPIIPLGHRGQDVAQCGGGGARRRQVAASGELCALALHETCRINQRVRQPRGGGTDRLEHVGRQSVASAAATALCCVHHAVRATRACAFPAEQNRSAVASREHHKSCSCRQRGTGTVDFGKLTPQGRGGAGSTAQKRRSAEARLSAFGMPPGRGGDGRISIDVRWLVVKAVQFNMMSRKKILKTYDISLSSYRRIMRLWRRRRLWRRGWRRPR